AERPALPETDAAVERLRRPEGRMTAGLEEQLLIAALASHLEDVIEQRSTRTMSTKRCGRSHRFHLALGERQLLESRATEQRAILPGGPEDDSMSPQPACVEGKH